MGSGPSRGKRVAPACVGEVSVTKTAAPKEDNSRPFKPLKIHAILRSARNRAQPDCHSEGHDSDFSREDDDVDGELDAVLGDYGERGRKNRPKTPVARSKTYGLCHFSQEDDEEPSPEETRVSNCGSRDVNKSSDGAFKHTAASPRQPGVPSSFQGFQTRGALLEAGPTTEKQQTFGKSSSVAAPVILYDGPEEELMDTIEREFS
ncbi:uncharacterized protein [Brachionichthys hirsutus]|uniref:uncharacterized protein n=1 Tax=Brachionichthys hirsutus TaxID=412623 RepID=UPI0036052202